MTTFQTGLELSASFVRMVQISRDRQHWKLVRRVEIPFAPGTLDMSNKSENIQNPEQFLQTLKNVLKTTKGRVVRVGLSLPNEIIKLAVHTWDELPKSREKIHEMLAWKEKDLLPFPVEKAITSFFHLNGMQPGRQSLLAAVGSREIIRDYETHLRRAGVEPEVMQPSAINHLNFYSAHLPSSGICGFLGILEDYFAFFAFEEKNLVFYRGKRRQALQSRFLQDIAMTMELYQDENPGKSIEKLFIQSQIPLPHEFYGELRRECDFATATLDEADMIAATGGAPIAPYASAIGAAQSLAGF